MSKAEDVKRLYECYVRYRSGDENALAEVFQNEYYYTEDGNEQVRVGFTFNCLNEMKNKAMSLYGITGRFTGYENGDKLSKCGYKKYHEGIYDVTEIEELIQEIVVELFNCPLVGDKPVIEGRVSRNKIKDGYSLLANIKWQLTIRTNQENKSIDYVMSEARYNSEEEEFSLYDTFAARQYFDTENNLLNGKKDIRESRLEIYEECLYWMKRNDICQLFNTSSTTKKAIVNTLLDCNYDTFIENDGGGMSLQSQERMIDLIKEKTDVELKQANLSADMKYIEQKLLDHTLYSLTYQVGKAQNSQGKFFKESERYLYELDEKSYIKMFGRESRFLYKMCDSYLSDELKETLFLMILEDKEDVAMPLILKFPGQKKYDMANAVTGDWDVVCAERTVVIRDIAEMICQHYQQIEDEYMIQLLQGYELAQGIKDVDVCCWEFVLSKGKLAIRLYSGIDVKKPVRKVIARSDLMVYEGFADYYVCNVNEKIYYKLQKKKRVISRSNTDHQIFMQWVA